MEPSVPLVKFVKNPLYQEIRYIEGKFIIDYDHPFQTNFRYIKTLLMFRYIMVPFEIYSTVSTFSCTLFVIELRFTLLHNHKNLVIRFSPKFTFIKKELRFTDEIGMLNKSLLYFSTWRSRFDKKNSKNNVGTTSSNTTRSGECVQKNENFCGAVILSRDNQH
ncbi:unnamed protein product [Rhizophagus irregularis]|nr:unnamed protein product [Rhizophagus irregularis]